MKTWDVLEKMQGAAKWLWNSPLCGMHRELYNNCRTGPAELLRPVAPRVRKGFVAHANMMAVGGLICSAAATFGALYLAVSVPAFISWLLTVKLMEAGIASGLFCIGGLITTMGSAAGAGIVKGSAESIDRYFAHNGDRILATRPPEELAAARAQLLRTLDAGKDFKAAAAPVVTGEAVTPMKVVKLKQPQSSHP
ncbi:MAG: hypothetical protein ACAH80_01440 [Alphaproteobacteria bacterium]